MKLQLPNNTSKHFLPLLFVANVLVIALCALIFGFRFEDMSDIFFDNMFKGNFCNTPQHLFNNYPALFPFSYVFQALHSLNNTVPWYGIVMSALFACIVFAYQYLLLKLAQYYKLYSFYTNIAVVLVLLLLLPDIIFLQYTKIGFYIANGGLFLAFYAMLTHSKSKTIWITSAMFILIALSIRSMIVPVPLLFFFVFVFLFYKDIFKSKLLWVVGIAILLTMSASFSINRAYTDDDNNYGKIKKLKELIFDYSVNENNDIYKSEKDSMKLVAYSNFLISDEANFTDDLYKQITNNSAESRAVVGMKELATDPGYVKHKLLLLFNKLVLIAKVNFLIILSYILFTLYCFVLFIRNKNNKQALNLVLYNIAALIFLVGFSLLIKMESRLLLPLLVISYLYTLILLLKHTKPNSAENSTNKYILYFAALLLILNVSQKLYMSYNWGNVTTQKNKLYRLLDTEQKNRDIVVWDVLSFSILYPNIYASATLPANKTNLSVDCGYLFLTQSYKDYMRKKTGSTTFKEYVAYLIANKERVVLISNENKMKLLTDYMRVIYSIEFKPEKLYPNPVIDSKSVVGDYNVFYLYKLQ